MGAKRIIRVALGLAAMTIVAACGGAKSGSSADFTSVEDQLGFDKAGIAARQAKVENLVQECMKQQGFEYVPVDPAARDKALVGGALTEEEFEKQYGYGLTTLYEQRKAQAAGGVNEQTRAALDPAGQGAYDQALLGDPGSDTFAVAMDHGDFTKLGGCTKSATENAFGGPGLAQSVQSKLDELDERIVADARMQQAIKNWSACMKTEGYDLTKPDEVDATLLAKLSEIVGTSSAPITVYDTVALAALQREEVAMVTADLKCEKANIRDVEQAVRADLEKAFREQNADLVAKVPAP